MAQSNEQGGFNERLDEILEQYRLFANMAYSEVEDGFHTADEFKDVALPKVLDGARQAILDWHNKRIEEVLDRLENIDLSAVYSSSMHVEAIQDTIEAERNKLNPSKSTPFNELKEES